MPRRFNLPDLLVALFAVAVIAVVVAVVLPRHRHDARVALPVPVQLRTIHQSLLLHGFDHNQYLPGLTPNGDLATNNPAQRFALLTNHGYLDPEMLLSPDTPKDAPTISYTLLDIAEPGDRRDAWTTDLRPLAPVLSERPDAFAARPAFVMLHDANVADLLAPTDNPNLTLTNPRSFDRPVLDTRYLPPEPPASSPTPDHLADHLFESTTPHDALLLPAD
ncbi:MAG: hypothetical protein AAFX76_09460 [Planctomycetota bacterium]